MLDLWRDIRGKEGRDLNQLLPERITYRATSPLYAGDEYRIVLGEGDGGKSELQIITSEGKVGMKGEIVSV